MALVVCTADLGRPTQVINFGRKYPDRYFNFGIAERNMIGAAAGLATTGLTPVISNYSFFLALMGVENIRNDICYTDLPVKMVGTHSGIAMGFYGTSHHCNEDIGALRAIANLTLMAPCDGNAIRAALTTHIDHPHPIYFRCGRGREAQIYDTPPNFEIGGSNQLRDGDDVSILAIGNLVKAACDASDRLKKEGIGARVVDMYSINPIDRSAIRQACQRPQGHRDSRRTQHHRRLRVGSGRRHCRRGLRRQAGQDWNAQTPTVCSVPPTHLYAHYGLDGEGVAKRVREAVD